MASALTGGARTFWISPLSSNKTVTSGRLLALGIRYRGFDHRARAYVGCEIPPASLAMLDRLLGGGFRWGAEPDALGDGEQRQFGD
jgi:hypothetical protein